VRGGHEVTVAVAADTAVSCDENPAGCVPQALGDLDSSQIRTRSNIKNLHGHARLVQCRSALLTNVKRLTSYTSVHLAMH